MGWYLYSTKLYALHNNSLSFRISQSLDKTFCHKNKKLGDKVHICINPLEDLKKIEFAALSEIAKETNVAHVLNHLTIGREKLI